MTLESSSSLTIDLADVVSQLMSTGADNRKLELIIDCMLGGDKIRSSITPFDVKAMQWMSSEVPYYLSCSRSVLLLAHRRQTKISSHRILSGYEATAVDIPSNNSVVVSARDRYASEIIAIITSLIRNARHV